MSEQRMTDWDPLEGDEGGYDRRWTVWNNIKKPRGWQEHESSE